MGDVINRFDASEAERGKIRNPQEVVLMLRTNNYFSPDKDHKEEVDIVRFMEDMEIDLKRELKLKINPVLKEKSPIEVPTGKQILNEEGELEPEVRTEHVRFHLAGAVTKQDKSFVDMVIEILEDAGYLEYGKVSHKPDSEAAIESIMGAVKVAVTQAVLECPPLSEQLKRDFPRF